MNTAPAQQPTSLHIRRAAERGHANHGWLDSHHTFSFAGYYDPRQMGFGHLRVINEDRVAPGRGFGAHPHRDMEIISYVIDGGLAHRDSMGSGAVLRPGEVQVMSAGTGVVHAEFNASQTEPVHFLQIWILPARRGAAPRYDQKAFDWAERTDRFRPIVSGDGRDGSLVIGQDAVIESALLKPGAQITRTLGPGRMAWIHVATGAIELDGTPLAAGDAAAVTAARPIEFRGIQEAQVLFFDLLAVEPT